MIDCAMADPDSLLPPSPVPGLIPTLNKTGWMTVGLDPYSEDFAQFAGKAPAQVLDIGCAYGVATLQALKHGARVLACDIEPAHLDILRQRVPDELRARLETLPATMPDCDFPAGRFSAVLAARVLHFLDGAAIRQTIGKMYTWLRPGGRLYLVADSPYTGPWAKYADRYEQRKSAGQEWPGFVDDYVDLLPEGTEPAGHPSFINPLDPDLLERECRLAGFDIMAASFLAGSTKWSTGREHAGVIALKPD
jgi:SAM-dependent methyltransferase